MKISPNLPLRIAVAFAFLYPAFAALIMPEAWIGYFPDFIRGIAPTVALLSIWSVVEVIIGLWILSGRRIFIPSIAAGTFLLLIVVFNTALLDIVFRDISLALVAFWLAEQSRLG